MKKVVKGFASVILASMFVFIGCKPPTSTSDPSTGGSEQTGQSKITVTVKGDERIESEQAFKIPSGSAWSSIKAEIEGKIKPSADWKDDWNKGDYALYEWRLDDENGAKINADYRFTDNITVYAVSNYAKWKIEDDGSGNKVLSGVDGSKPRGKIILPDSVTSIGDFAFTDCLVLTAITIPTGVRSIGDFAFSNCSSLSSITIPAGVRSIGDSAFSNCSSLSSITIPDSVTAIENFAFSYCSALTAISIPASVTGIGEWAFVDCKKLETLTVDSGNTVYKSDKNIIYTKDGKSLIAVAGALSGTIDIPDSVTSIGDSAFFGCSALTGITIPIGVRLIGNWAFAGCSSLSTVNIPASVTWIGIRAFSGCSSLSDITIPASVTSIGYEAFRNCNKLTSVRFADPKGWAVYNDNNHTKEADIDESKLKDKSVAAKLLRDTYSELYWKKKN